MINRNRKRIKFKRNLIKMKIRILAKEASQGTKTKNNRTINNQKAHHNRILISNQQITLPPDQLKIRK